MCAMFEQWHPLVQQHTHMNAPFPSPPNLDRSTAQAVADWLDAMADSLSAEHAAARSHGHEVSGESLKNLDLYKGHTSCRRSGLAISPWS